MSKVKFQTAISYGMHKQGVVDYLVEYFDDYFYFRGKKAFVIPNDRLHARLQHMPQPNTIRVALKVVQALSYLTLAIPLFMLAGKLILRRIRTIELISEDSKKKSVNIENKSTDSKLFSNNKVLLRSTHKIRKNLTSHRQTIYPINSTVTKLNSTFQIKQMWLYNEWGPECQFSMKVRPYFPNRSELDPANKNPNVELINSTFYNYRGKNRLWQTLREEGIWRKVETPNLSLDWVKNNVEVLFPVADRFPVTKLIGIVLWDDKEKNQKRFKLYEGNHRISAWLSAQKPKCLPAIIFIGEPKKEDPKLEKN